MSDDPLMIPIPPEVLAELSTALNAMAPAQLFCAVEEFAGPVREETQVPHQMMHFKDAASDASARRFNDMFVFTEDGKCALVLCDDMGHDARSLCMCTAMLEETPELPSQLREGGIDVHDIGARRRRRRRNLGLDKEPSGRVTSHA